MFDPEKCIELVKQLPCLYERKDPEYNDKNARDRAWASVAAALFDDWDEGCESTKEERVNFVKTKWRNMKDTYFKSVHLPPGPKKKRRYIYAQQMSFLQHCYRSSARSSPRSSLCRSKPVEPTPVEEPKPVTSGACVATENPISSDPASKRNLTYFEEVLLRRLDEYKSSEVEQDGDKLFLLSLLPDYKKLRDDEKIEFKIKTLQIFRDIRNNRIDSNETKD